MRVLYVTKEDMFADMEVQVAYDWGRWRYVAPPLLIFEQKGVPRFFLRPDSNRWEPMYKARAT